MSLPTQTQATLLIEVLPGHEQPLREALRQLAPASGPGMAGCFLAGFPDVHFACLSVLTDMDEGQPALLLFELNIDGPLDRFLGDLLDRAAAQMDAILSHCAGYPSRGLVAKPAVRLWLTAQDVGVTCGFVALPGRGVGQIRAEAALRREAASFVTANHARLQRPEAGLIQQALRSHLQHSGTAGADAAAGSGLTARRFQAWPLAGLDPAPPRPFLVRHGERLAVAALIVLPFLALWSLFDLVGLPARLAFILAAAGLVVLATQPALRNRLLGGLGALFFWPVRLAERADRRRYGAADMRWTGPAARDVLAGEDLPGTEQNHMLAVHAIKPGLVRRAALWLVLRAIHLLGKVWFNRGFLGPIATIHFARWVMIRNNSRLLFLSNFDGSWESYLGDFTDKASAGLSAIWSNTWIRWSGRQIGFPETRWLIFGGARDEERFKNFARYGMARTDFWYSAYPDLSVVAIETATGLRRDVFGPVDAVAEQRVVDRLQSPWVLMEEEGVP